MKVKVISRDPDKYIRDTKKDLRKTFRNYDPTLHPFQSAREYVRALNATKLERVFAKPFVGNLNGHKDGVAVLAKHPKKLSMLASGAYDGEVKIWSVASRNCIRSLDAHSGYCRGIAFSSDGMHAITIGDDKTIKTWAYEQDYEEGEQIKPVNMIPTKGMLVSLSHCYYGPNFATSGDTCHIWDESRNEPLKELKWGVDMLQDIKYNPVETSLLAACASDRGIILYDQREEKPLRKVVMTLRSNQLAWNPMQAFFFTVANEDNNLYTYDTRNLEHPLKIHKGHVSSVTSVDYSPTGNEFVSGSYDKTIRIFDALKLNSREIYHTKRMQHVTCVNWSMDNKYVFNGSDEMNVRIWKANAAEKLGSLKMREKNAFNYNAALKEKYAAHPAVRRIAQHRQVPKSVYHEQAKLRTVHLKEKRKEENVRQNSKPGTVPYVSEVVKKVVKKDH
ncbi:DDB1- and CUL4-associated factor 13 [Anopheles ziemanni]|uniref:DDB1- and CUL4-associated factor 13 n=1 Tax=Anopheles coustani TaxID=139045 RepID=UPI00265B6D0A|nr:DDB1- and CUL4-associated factor 13 [Anopheles coustani]XP_058175464.1 DDB1- and CUL4-associated factor 13 [Anopheles ziemanni]